MTTNMSLETKEKLYNDLKDFMKQQIGENKYFILLAYESGERQDKQTGKLISEVLSNQLTNLDARSPYILLKGIFQSLVGEAQRLRNDYDLKP